MSNSSDVSPSQSGKREKKIIATTQNPVRNSESRDRVGVQQCGSKQCQSGLVLVTTSCPQVCTVSPPPDECPNVMNACQLVVSEDSLTIQDVECNGKEYQVLKNTVGKCPESEALPDKERIEPRQSLDLLLAQLNSQLLDQSLEMFGTKDTAKTRQFYPAKRDTTGIAKNFRAVERPVQGAKHQSRSKASKSSHSEKLASQMVTPGSGGRAEQKITQKKSSSSKKTKSAKSSS